MSAMEPPAVIEAIVAQLLAAIGEDPNRAGLKDTPRRVAAFWREWMEWQPGNLDATFEAVHTVNELVTVSDVQLWSLCEHHLLPFSCNVAVGYIANGTVVGLSKLARVAQNRAHKLQLQERLVAEIAKDVQALAETQDVAVVAKGRHLCMEMRGIRTPGLMTTSAMRGNFLADERLRAEFLELTR